VSNCSCSIKFVGVLYVNGTGECDPDHYNILARLILYWNIQPFKRTCSFQTSWVINLITQISIKH